MTYLAVILLCLRPLISEQVSLCAGILFDIFFCLIFLLIMLKQKIIIAKPRIMSMLLFFCLIVLGTGFFSVNSFVSQREIFRVFNLFLVFVFVGGIGKRQRYLLLNGMIAVSFLIGLRAVYQSCGGMQYISTHFTPAQITQGGFYGQELLKQKRVISFFVSPNLLASYLSMMILAVSGFLLQNISKKSREKTIWQGVILMVLAVAFVATKSIGAYLGLAAGIIFFISQNKIRLIRWVILGVVFFCALWVMGSKRADYFLDFNNKENSLVQRLFYWKSSMRMIQEHPFLGFGPASFGIVYPRFKAAQANETLYSHNMYLQMCAESGMFSLLCLVVFIGSVFACGMRGKHDLRKLGLLSGAFAFLIHNIVDYSFFISQTAYVWWVFMANIISWDKKEMEESRQSLVAGIFLKNCFVALAIFVICFNYMDYAAEINLKKAEYLARQKKYTLALSSVQKSLMFRNNNDNAYYVSALLRRRQNSRVFSTEVADSYLKAILLNPQYSFYPYELGKYFYEYGKTKQAKYFFDRACRLYPDDPRFRAALDKISSR